jgi:hypothetical protein
MCNSLQIMPNVLIYHPQNLNNRSMGEEVGLKSLQTWKKFKFEGFNHPITYNFLLKLNFMYLID